MIVKFHARGAGRGSGPVDYLLGKDRARDGVTLDRGDPDAIQDLIDSSPYTKKYTSGVLSFEESDLDRTTKDKIMSSFEKALLPGLDADQYSCLWVEHRDKGRLELNFVVPNLELQSGKRLQPYFDKADRPRINAWKVQTNDKYSLHDPDDPINKRELTTPRTLPQAKQEAARAITDGLLSHAESGAIQDRSDVIQTLTESGFEVVRQTKQSISIADPDGGRNIRLKGMIYEQDFKFSAGLRKEIEAASERYRKSSKERVREAREVYQRCFESKREENQRRYPRAEQTHEISRAQELELDRYQRVPSISSRSRNVIVARTEDSGQYPDHTETESHAREVEQKGWKNTDEHLWRQEATLHQNQSERGQLRSKRRLENSKRVLSNDGTRNTSIERIREYAERARDTIQSVSRGLRELRDNVQSYISREREDQKPSQQLERTERTLIRASFQLERTVKSTGRTLQQEERTLERSNRKGFSLGW